MMRSLCLLVVLLTGTQALAGDVTFQVPVGSHLDFNLGPIGEVTLCQIIVQGVAVDSVLDCDGTPTAASSGITVRFDDEGTLLPVLALSMAFFAGPVEATVPVAPLDPSGWDILDDGVGRLHADVLIQDSAAGCTLQTSGSMTIPSGTIGVRLVYEAATMNGETAWSTIKSIYR
jgi:hypothetical protein